MEKSLLVLGAGGHGRVVADAALDCGYERIAFLDDAASASGKSGPFEIVGRIADLETFLQNWPAAMPAVGNNRLRLEIFRRLEAAGFSTPCLLHPSAIVSRHAVLGDGTFLAAGAIVNIGATIGEAAILNTGATVDHDCFVGAGAHISPGANLAGNVTVGECAWVGIGASVRNGMRIGPDAVVGAGSAVVRDVPDAQTFAGAPARPLRSKPGS